MSAISFKENNIDRLSSFMNSDAFDTLSSEEKGVLSRYAQLEQSGTLDKRTVVQISQYDDPTSSRHYPGGGTVEEAVKANYTDEVELKYFMVQRPYLFFANPATHEFYFMKNPDTLADDVTGVEILDVSSREWVNIDDVEPFFGRPPAPGDAGTSADYPGLIKSHFLVTQFSRDEEKISLDRNKVKLRVAEESLDPKPPGEKYYCESQKNSYCQMHAANAFLGYGAIRPNDLAKYIAQRAAGFGQSSLEDPTGVDADHMTAAAKELLGTLLDIEYGIDLGLVVDYMHQLESEGALRLSVAEMQVGDLSYSDERGLEFVNHAAGTRHVVDEEFLASRSRAMLGTYQPIHASALRKNTDGSWTRIDSSEPSQQVFADLKTSLAEIIVRQQQGDTKLSLPCAFM
ncbi:hypothetical protein [Simkania sp.]|uniref:hypothetical protein n=1 Tax=Simkania sp. TaxID=34094 RepID=UPI003B517AC0